MIVADGRTYEIPSDLTETEAISIGGLYPAVDGLVPTEVRDELEAMRSAYAHAKAGERPGEPASPTLVRKPLRDVQEVLVPRLFQSELRVPVPGRPRFR